MIIDRLENLNCYKAVLPGIEEGMKAVEALGADPAVGRYEFEGGYFMIQAGETVPIERGDYEAHRKYIDVQIILQGREEIAWADLGTLKTTEAYNEQKDKEMLGGEAEYTAMINAGTFWVALPQDAHKACKHTAAPSTYKKVVMKLPVVK